VTICGAGFAGMAAVKSLREKGITDIRVFERGAEVGGTWYWNRYPGAAVDIQSAYYSYSFTDKSRMGDDGWQFSHKFSKQPELFVSRARSRARCVCVCRRQLTVVSVAHRSMPSGSRTSSIYANRCAFRPRSPTRECDELLPEHQLPRPPTEPFASATGSGTRIRHGGSSRPTAATKSRADFCSSATGL
jgi:hypothetical protein